MAQGDILLYTNNWVDRVPSCEHNWHNSRQSILLNNSKLHYKTSTPPRTPLGLTLYKY